jgi:hypothetical protein
MLTRFWWARKAGDLPYHNLPQVFSRTIVRKVFKYCTAWADNGEVAARRDEAIGLAVLLQGGSFMAAQLRVYPGSQSSASTPVQEPSVHISLRELLPLLAVAQRRNYLWLSDFLDDEVCVTPDLYEVLHAFQSYRPSA